MKSYFMVFYEDLKKSVKPNKNMLYSLGFDFLFVVLCLVGFFVLGMALISKGEIIQTMNYSAMFTLDKVGLEKIDSIMASFLTFFVTGLILFWGFIIAAFSFCQSSIWFSYSKKKRTIKTFMKVVGINFIIITPSFIMLIYIMAKLKEDWILLYIILFTVMMHFAGIMNLHFAYHHKAKRALYKIFEHGILKIHHFVIPYFLIICIYFTLIIGVGFISQLTHINYYLLIFLTMLFFSAYVRNYFVIVAKREVKHA